VQTIQIYPYYALQYGVLVAQSTAIHRWSQHVRVIIEEDVTCPTTYFEHDGWYGRHIALPQEIRRSPEDVGGCRAKTIIRVAGEDEGVLRRWCSANTYSKGSQEEDTTLGVLKDVLDGVSRGLWK
jgi:hypothetical protein